MTFSLNAIKSVRHPEVRFRRTPGARLEGRKMLMQQQTETPPFGPQGD
jgi:hypothetical protein